MGGFDLEFVSGTIDRNRMPTFERILWRVLRGNLYMNYSGEYHSLTAVQLALPSSHHHAGAL